MRLITILYYWIRYYLFYGHWDFHKAAYDGDLKTLKDLLKYLKIDPSRKNNIAIRDASYNGHLEVVKELLKDPRVDPSDVNNAAICCASDNGNVEIVKELLKDKRVDPSSSCNYPIRWASYKGHLEVVKELLKDKRVDPSFNYNNFIKTASYNGHLEVVRELLKDSRVNWEHVSIEHKKLLIKEEKDKLRKDLTFSYLLISKISPQINIENKIVKSAIPKSLIKRISYYSHYIPQNDISRFADIKNIPTKILLKFISFCELLNLSMEDRGCKNLSESLKSLYFDIDQAILTQT